MRNALFVAALVLALAFPIAARERMASGRALPGLGAPHEVSEPVDFEAMAFDAGAALGKSGDLRLQQTLSRGMSRNTKIVLGAVALGLLVYVVAAVLAVNDIIDDVLPEEGNPGPGTESLAGTAR